MTPVGLRGSAAVIQAAAKKYDRLADRADTAGKPELAALNGAVARQLHNRAAQVLTWAAQAEHTGTVTPDMENGTREFLKYAGV